MTNKKQVIAQTRQKRSADEAHHDFTRKQKKERGVMASFLIFKNITVLKNPNELLSLVDKLIIKHQNKGEELDRSVEEKSGVVTYEFMEKNLCISIARHAQKSFKNHHPEIKIQNPKNNEFYRVIVEFKA